MPALSGVRKRARKPWKWAAWSETRLAGWFLPGCRYGLWSWDWYYGQVLAKRQGTNVLPPKCGGFCSLWFVPSTALWYPIWTCLSTICWDSIHWYGLFWHPQRPAMLLATCSQLSPKLCIVTRSLPDVLSSNTWWDGDFCPWQTDFWKRVGLDTVFAPSVPLQAFHYTVESLAEPLQLALHLQCNPVSSWVAKQTLLRKFIHSFDVSWSHPWVMVSRRSVRI